MGYPPPAAYPPPPPPAATRSVPGMEAHPSQPYGSQPMAAPYGGSQPMAVPQPMAAPYGGSQPGTPPMGSMEMEKLRQDLEREVGGLVGRVVVGGGTCEEALDLSGGHWGGGYGRHRRMRLSGWVGSWGSVQATAGVTVGKEFAWGMFAWSARNFLGVVKDAQKSSLKMVVVATLCAATCNL